jgi:manganese/zinc/iron transport system ATP- binding protein
MDEPFSGVDISTEKMLVTLFHEMRDSGKTIVIVHHDLNTVPDYFDRVVMINTRLIGSGKISEVFQPEVIRETYGGKLTILNGVADVLGGGGYRVGGEKTKGK